MLTVPTEYLAGNNLGIPRLATPGSMGYDLCAVLTRACRTVDKEEFFNWKSERKPKGDRDLVTDLIREIPGEVEKIKSMAKFPENYLSLRIEPGETILVPLGIKTEIPLGYGCLLFPRASSATKQYRLGNAVGVIDSDYRDEWFAAIRNSGPSPLLIQHGQAVVQAVYVLRTLAAWPAQTELSESARTGGFGSTGDLREASQELVLDEAEASLSAEIETESDTDSPVASAVDDVPAAPLPESLAINLSVTVRNRTIEVGPVAKFRTAAHTPLLQTPEGVKAISDSMLRDLKVLLPRALPRLLAQIKNET